MELSVENFRSYFSGLYPVRCNCSKIRDNEYHIDFSGYKNGSLDGIMIVYENDVCEVSEYQAGPNQDELHVLKEYKNVGSAVGFIKGLLAGAQKPAPIKIWR